MASVSAYRVLCAGLALAVMGVWEAPAPAGAQGLVSANISGTVTKRSDGSVFSPGRTVTATCSYNVSPFTQTFTATTSTVDGSYTIAAQGEVSGSNCIVKVSPCPGSNPIQRTVNIPPSASGVNFGCSS